MKIIFKEFISNNKNVSQEIMAFIYFQQLNTFKGNNFFTLNFVF